MLRSLKVKNIALISELELELMNGLNVLSGETGAGKSIIIDSLSFLLGERADKSLVRYGESFAEVEGVFEVADTSNVKAVLDDLGIEFDGTVIIRRKMTTDGRGDIRINGASVTLGMLKSVTECLCDIYGQHEHQSLLKTASHIKLLDKFGGSDILAVKNEFSQIYDQYREIKAYLDGAGNEFERMRRADLLKYQIDEIEQADLEVDEDIKLEELRSKIKHTERIVADISDAANCLSSSGEGGAETLINLALRSIGSAMRFDPALGEVYARLESVYIEASDIAETLKSSLNEYDFSASRAAEIESRHEQIKLLKRKYGDSVEKILNYLDQAKSELDELENSAEMIEKKRAEFTSVRTKLFEKCVDLSAVRREYAHKFEDIIKSELGDLGMSGTTFEITFASAPDIDVFESVLSTNGIDDVAFMISPNKGEPLKPLSKIVSGGEMSRFMLACKKIIATLDGIETLVFDEVDSGISGRIAQVVSEKLFNIAFLSGQIIAVTHLPQLAAMSDNHYLIEKFEQDGKTLTHLKHLNAEDKEREVARLAGAENNLHSINHAREIIEFATNFKNTVRSSYSK